MPATILDAFGRPYQLGFTSSAGLYEPASGSRTRPSHPDLFADFAALLPRFRWRESVSDCRWISIAFPLVSGASEQKADYVSASQWRTFYTGRDPRWGDLAEERLAEVDQICTTRSPLFDWRALWWSGSIHHDCDGSFFLNLTSTADGFPLLQPIEAHRIGTCDTSGDGLVRGGRYDGARIVNGIIYDRAGREIAYRVISADPGKYEDISARDMVHVPGRVRWFSEGRPLPRIAPALLDLYDVRDTRESERIAQNVNSRLTVIEENETGTQDPTQQALRAAQARTAAGTDTEIIEKGFWRYVKAGRGGIKAHESSRPSDQWQRFDDKVTATALYGMGWRIEMFDLSKLAGAATRGFQDQINTTIATAFQSMRPYVLRARRYMVAKLIQRGDLPENPDWYKWEVQEPPEFTVDPSRAIKSDLEAVRAGALAMPDIHRRWGKRPREVLTDQARYLKMRAEVAKSEGVSETDLGRLDLPGDAAPSATASASAPSPVAEPATSAP